jgi:hypothetical protein
MIGLLKSLQSVVSGVLTDLPEGVQMVTEFLYRIRWFIIVGLVLVGIYMMVMTVLPYLMWYLIIKLVVGSLFSLITL